MNKRQKKKHPNSNKCYYPSKERKRELRTSLHKIGFLFNRSKQFLKLEQSLEHNNCNNKGISLFSKWFIEEILCNKNNKIL